MRIAISGTQCVGKTTVIKDILKNWNMYETPDKTYRDAVKEANLPCNQKSTTETQQLIMDFLCDQTMSTKVGDMKIFDRSPHDALAYSMWCYLKGVEGFDDEFMKKQIYLAREASKFLDIIFYIPLTEKYNVPIVEDELRDTDPNYRKEIDNIFAEIYTNPNSRGVYFDPEDCPAVIEIFGTPEERLEMIKFYINENGKMYGEEDSMIADDIIVPN
jgi:predicted ATPase